MADYTTATLTQNEHTGMQDGDRRIVQSCAAAGDGAAYGLFKL